MSERKPLDRAHEALGDAWEATDPVRGASACLAAQAAALVSIAESLARISAILDQAQVMA